MRSPAAAFAFVVAAATVAPSLAAAANQPPQARADSVRTAHGTETTIHVLGNDTDRDGDRLAVAGVTQPRNGKVRIDESRQRLRYKPRSGFSGTDQFSYTVRDGRGGTSSATVTIVVQAPVNAPPVANADTAKATAGKPESIYVRKNDSDKDKDQLTIRSVTQGGRGSVRIDESRGHLIYTARPGYSGVDSFRYTISDNKGGSASATVLVTVSPGKNSKPDTRDDAATTVAGRAVTIPVLANDRDPDGDRLAIDKITKAPSKGTAAIRGSVIVYTPKAGFTGSDSLKYKVSDGRGGERWSTVRIAVNAAPASKSPAPGTRSGAAPVAKTPAPGTRQDAPTQGSVASGSAVLSWTVPTSREDGSPLAASELAGYEIYLLAESTGETQVITISNPLATSYTVSGLPADVYHFSMAAKDRHGRLSPLSTIVSKKVVR